MKRIVILFTILTSSVLLAQVNENYNGIKPEIYSGSKALVFSYTPFQSNLSGMNVSDAPVSSGDDFELIAIQGFGMKYFVSNHISLLFGLGFGTGSSEYSGNDGTDYESSATYVGVALDVNYHFPSLYNISSYLGFNFNFGANTAEDVITYLQQNRDDEKVEYSSSSVGVGLNLGFEWFFTEGISLGGKYTLGYKNYFQPEITISEGSESEIEKGRSATAFAIGAGTITLSVHF